MQIHVNRRYMPSVTEDPLKDNEDLIECIKRVLLDSRGVPSSIPHWEWIQHFVDPFVNTYSPIYKVISQEGWPIHNIKQCKDFIGIILSNLPIELKKKAHENLADWTAFSEGVEKIENQK